MKTLEEDKLSIQKKFTAEYFDLRLKQERMLQQFKDTQKLSKKNLVKAISSINGVSKRTIDDAISFCKKINIKTPEDIYDTVVNSLHQNNKRYYINNRHLVIEYIEKLQILKKDLIKFKGDLKNDLNKFKKTNLYCNVSVLNNYYSKFTNDLKTFLRLGITVDEYERLVKEYNFAEEIMYEIFIKEAKKIEIELLEYKKQEQIKLDNQKVYENVLSSMFISTDKKEKDQEDEIMQILLAMGV